jgi:acyl transferase domain-containing protein/NAD(P)-dependent dehydrogenase (short-subunit alcohol dehydrogenase family)/acyl carrier protein
MVKERKETESKATGRTPPCEIAIVGIGCLFPKAAGTGHFWANVKTGLDCIGDIPKTHWNPDDYFDADPKSPDMTYARRGGFLDPIDFNPMEFGIAPRDLEATDTTQLLGLVAAKQALTDAKVDLQKVDRSRVSVILGVTGTLELVVPLGARLGHPHWRRAMKDAGIPDELAKDAVERIGDAYVPWQENSFPGLLGNVVAGRIANRLDLHGTNCVVDAACASSLSAVHLASLELAAGRADVVVTGGADTFNDIFMFMCFSKTPALSPTGNSKPFDATGDGTILGEGIGTVVLKRRADAERDGDTIYTIIKSVGTSSDGKGNAIYAPSADGQVRCLTNAFDLAGVTPDTIELIEAHGTGTKVGDGVEASALTKVFTEQATTAKAKPWCALGSVKSQIGHTKAAAGVAGLIKAALALYNKVLPPTIKVTKPVDPLNAADSPFYVNLEARPWLPRREHPRRAGLSAFGFGGSNFHCVLEEHRLEKRDPDWDGSVEILAITGQTNRDVAEQLENVPTKWDDFAFAAERSRSTFSETASHRLLLVAHRTRTDLAALKQSALAQLAEPSNANEWTTPEGAYFGSGQAVGTLAVLFPGQGSQAPGMLRDLVNLFPEALTSVAVADAAGPPDQPRLSDFIYPPTSFAPDANDRNVSALTRTQRAQSALGAVEFAAWKILNGRFGVRADAAAGHSYGELAALSAAGRISPADFFRLSSVRGQLMADVKTGEASGMSAILADADTVQSILDAAGGQAVLANRNGPKQSVISGSLGDLERAERICKSRSVRFVRLPVAAAFHSPFVASAAAPFRDVLNSVTFGPSATPVYANSTALPYPADPIAARDLLGHQLAKPVLFDEQIRAMVEAGVRTFIEVGPGAKLSRMAADILAGDPGQASSIACIALDSSSGSRPGTLDLAHALARLAARGHTVTLSAWERESRCRPAVRNAKPGLTVPICGANFVAPRPARPPREPMPITAEKTMAEPVRPNPLDSTAIAAALDNSQRALAALQQMQEQAASLHRQFLDTQQQAQQTIAVIVAQQHAALGLPGAAMPMAPAPAPIPVPPHAPVPQPVHVVETAPVAVVKPVEQPAPVPAQTAPVITPSAGPSPDRVLLEVVAEKTGYPVSTLDLSMSLDNDLGVDSIKRVEILSALQDRLPDAPVVKPEHLGTLHTLKDVVDFLAGGTAAVAPIAVAAPSIAASAAALISTISSPNVNSIAEVLLDVVSQKTGYPVGTLDLSMTMDNDLGIDSIKRVEILSSIQERLPDAPAVKPEQLGTIRSLKDLADFLGGTPNPPTVKIPIDSQTIVQLSQSTRDGMTPPPSTHRNGTSELKEPPTETISKINQAKASDSVLMASGSQVVAQPGSRSIDATSETSRPIPNFAADDPIDRSVLQAVDLDAAALRPRIAVPEGRDVIVVGDEGVFCREIVRVVKAAGFNALMMPWNAAGSARFSDGLAGLILLAPSRANAEPQLNTLAFQWIQRAGGTIRNGMKPSGVGVIASVTQFDGVFGISAPAADSDPTSGGLAGLIKTVYHEWPEVAAKAVDVSPKFIESDPSKAAAAVVEEILAVGPVEVGIAASHRCSLDLARTVRRQSTGPLPLGPGDVILITGGARGVTAEAAVALAKASKGTFVLTGRTAPPPAADPDWIAGIVDPTAMKKAIADQLGDGAVPKAVADQFARIQSHREIRTTIARIEAAGGRAVYYPVNVSNGRAVADLLHQVRVKFGPLTALVHGAGVLADRRIEQLTIEQFDTVYGTKAGGARLLLDLLRSENLKAVVLFGSTTGRLGRVGQMAYACANEVLNKLAQVEARRRPHARVVCINWGPWDGGMVTAGLRKMFESEGVGLIPLAEGGQFVVQELTAPGKAVEVIALGKLRGNSHPTQRTTDYSRGHVGSMQNVLPQPQVPPPTAAPATEMTLAFERMVDVTSHPVLRSHVLDGRAVLPMAIHLEWLAHAALHGNPGLQFIGIDNLRITSGVQIEASATATLKALAGRAVKQDKLFVVPVELRGRRKDGREVVHSRADVLLSATLPTAPAPDRPPVVQPYPHPVDEVYKYFLFHGPDLHAIERVEGLTEVAFVGTATAAPSPTNWFAAPLRSNWVADPLVLDASFQMLILWSFAQHGAGSLPCFAGRYRQFRRSFPTGPVKVVARVTRDNGTFARADIEYLDADGTMIAQLQDYECVIDAQLNMAFRRNQLAGGLVRV